jgi:type III pantothenate kinase
MDINLLVVSIGNTRLASGAFVAGEFQGATRASLGDRKACEEAIGQAWAKLAAGDGRAVAAASVNPKFNSLVDELVDRVARRSVEWVGPDIELPIDVHTQNPQQTGVDRVLNVAAAYEQMEQACIVVDAGTAITVDACNDNGNFIGGAIIPGIAMMIDALANGTAGIGKATFSVPAGALGDSTDSAVSHGVFYAIRGLVKEIAENYASQLGRWPEIIATGGDAQRLFGGWELIHAVSPDLGLYGIALAYTNHHIRHE